MAYWLLKTEPDKYSYADLAQDGSRYNGELLRWAALPTVAQVAWEPPQRAASNFASLQNRIDSKSFVQIVTTTRIATKE